MHAFRHTAMRYKPLRSNELGLRAFGWLAPPLVHFNQLSPGGRAGNEDSFLSLVRQQ